MAFHIENPKTWEKKYPLSAQKVKKITDKECRHWPKHWTKGDVKMNEDEYITVVVCKCGHYLTPSEMERIKKEEAKYYRK